MRWLDGITGHEFEHTLGHGEGQGSLTCCSPWGCKESDTTEQLINNSYKVIIPILQVRETEVLGKLIYWLKAPQLVNIREWA